MCVDGAVVWLSDFAKSAGFAGLLVVVAAVVAYVASTRIASKDRWWKRAEYALNMTLSSDRYERLAGLDLLSSMETRDPGERTFIRIALKWFLDRPTQDERGEHETTASAKLKPGPASRAGAQIDGLFRRLRQ